MKNLVSLVDLLRARTSAAPDRTACLFLLDGEVEQARLTYAGLDARARAIAASLQRRGAAGERILLLYPPGLDFIAAFFGCLYAGAVAVPAYPPRSGREQPRLRSILEDARPRFALAPSSIAARLDALAAGLPVLGQMERLVTDEISPELAAEWQEPALGPGDLAFLQYTSGSTSDPKGVMVSHGNLIANEEVIREACGHDEESTFVSWLPIYHDMGLIGAVLQPLYVGASCVLMSPVAFLQQPVRWLRAIARYRAHTSGAPDFAYDLAARKVTPEQLEGLDLSSWRVAFNGSEPVRAGSLERFSEAFAPCGFRASAFFPCYGLAEATLLVTGRSSDAAPEVRAFQRLDGIRPVEGGERSRPLVACGPPGAGVELAVVEPDGGAERAPGEVGEIWVSGPSVALGYWGQPEESERVFHARLTGRPGRHRGFLRTGDLGFLREGRLFVAGRLKDLILVRGRNLYPQDLEATVQASHPAYTGVGAAFAVEAPEGDEAERVVAVQEIEARRTAEAGDAIEAARKAVAEEHEIALHALLLVRPGAVPRTTSGKVQRRLCRRMFLEGTLQPVAEWRAEPGPEAASPVRPELSEDLAAWLAGRLAHRLGVPASRLDPDEPLVRQGLDSLAAVEMAHEIEVATGTRLDLSTFLESSLRSLSAKLSAADGEGRWRPLPRSGGGTGRGLSAGQRALWLVQKLDPESPENTIAGAARILGDVEAGALRRAFQALADRHPALRTAFEEEGGEPVRQVHPRLDPDFEEIDATGWSGLEFDQAVTAEVFRPFDLERGPLLRVRLFRRPGGERVLVLAIHHLVADLWSLAVLLRDLGALVSGASLPVVEETEAPYESDAPERRAYWQQRLDSHLAPLRLPTDRPRPGQPRRRAGAFLFDLPPEPLRSLGRRRGATLFASLLALTQALLHRVTGQDRVRLVSPAVGRPSQAQAEAVGYFVNPLVLASEAEDDPVFADLLGRARATVLEAFANEVPFPLLVERMGALREAQVAFALQRAPLGMEALSSFALGEPGARLDLGGLALVSRALPERPAQYDLALLAAETGGRLRAALVYDKDRFDGATAARLAVWLRNLAAGLGDGESCLSELPLMDEAERRQALAVRPASASPDGLIHELVAEQARRRPEAVAVGGPGGRSLTYAELHRRAGALARRLRALGVGTDARVAVLGERRPETIAGMLAVLQAGAGYLPLDPSHPPRRNAAVIGSTGAAAVLASAALALPETSVPVLLLDEDLSGEGAELLSGAVPESLAYGIHTSGSTGEPKAVAVSHRALLHLIGWHLADARLSPADRVSYVAGSAFDASVLEIWPTLAAGATLCLPDEESRRSPERLRDWLLTERVTVAFAPTAVAELLFGLDWPATLPLRLLLTGGDRLRIRPPGDLPFAVRDNYGPAEATVVATAGPVEANGSGLPDIGPPLPGTRAVLLDRRGQPVPPGLAGEIFLGGPGLARGYLGRPDLTAERFLPNPFGGSGERLYRTGDLARLRPDGRLDFLGRADDQVQVRGVRVEPAEVEAALAAHPAVLEAVVLAVDDPAGGVRLAAFVAGAAPAAELRAFLTERLPAVMVPALFIPVEALPLTPNGKVDRRALAASAPSVSSSVGAGPRDPVEEMVAQLWAAALGSGTPGVQDDFFALGGHSLLAARIAAQAGAAFGVEVTLRDVFEAPTVAGLAARVRQAAGGLAAGPIPVVPREPELPASYGQEGLWLFERLWPGSAAYHVPLALELAGDLDTDKLEAALATLAERHEALRTALPEVHGRPVQRIAPAAMTIPFRRMLEGETESEEARRPFDLENGPLWRAALVPGRLRLLLVFHHAICDGASIEVLLHDLAALLAGARLPPLELQPADWAAWQRRTVESGALEPRLTAWEGKLAGAPALQLLTDRPRPAAPSLRGFTVSLELPAEGLERLARTERATPFLALLAAFQALLYRWTGQTDLVVGSPVSLRDRAGLDSLVGLFVNLVAVRARVEPEPGFRALLQQVRGAALDAFRLADVPFEQVVERVRPGRGLSQGPLFQATVALDPGAPGRIELPGLTIEPRAIDTGTAKLDLGLFLKEDRGRWTAFLEMSGDLFDEATGERMLGGFARLLAAAVADPERPVAELPLLGEAERRHLLVEWNDRPAVDVPRACLHECFAAQAARTPDAVAVACDGEALTYRELAGRAEALARHLVAQGVRPGEPVAVRASRSVDTVAGFLAVLEAGGAFVPLDPSHPPERLRILLEECGSPAVLARPSEEVPRVALPSVPPESLAYVLFTSGSTGRPKGVACGHAGVLALLADLDTRQPLREGAVCSLWTSFSFDVSVYELFSALLSGGRLEIVPDPIRSDGRALAAWLAEHRVESAYVAPSMLGDLLGVDGLCLRRLLVGVEPIPEPLLAALAARVPGLTIVNGYGPTEATVCAALHTVGRSSVREGRTPIGRPVRGSRLYLLDTAGEPVPQGVPGELHAAGAGLAWGYWGRPGLTAERFVPDPFVGIGGMGERMYRTGDLARLLPTGELEFLGRVDRQLKLRGFRVEPSEVEAALRSHPGIRDAVADARTGPDGEARLVAWVVGDAEDLEAFLRGWLPDFMVPSAVVRLEALPVTANGKLDRAALPAPDWRRPELAGRYVAPRTPAEAALAEIWMAVLGLERAGAYDNFFDLGGHSLAAGRLVARLRESLGVDLPVRAVFEAPTLAEMAVRIDLTPLAPHRPSAGPCSPAFDPERGEVFPLSWAQQQIWIQEQLAPGSPVFHLPASLDCEGDLAVGPVAGALRELVRRQEALRACFVLADGKPVQTVGPAAAPLPVLDLMGLPEPALAAEASRLSGEEARQPFDLQSGPLIRSALLRLAPDRHRLLLTVHHLAADATSVALLLRELELAAAGTVLPEPPLQYTDFALWQRERPEPEALLRHWADRLRGLPPLDLPADRPRPAIPSGRGGRQPVQLQGRESLAALARAEGASIFMGLLAAFQSVLGRHAGRDEVAVGTAVENRPGAALDGLIGLFLETVVLRTGLAGDPTFRQLLGRARETVLDALAHQELPFQRLVEAVQPERDLARSPLFQAFFGLRSGPARAPALPGVRTALAERWAGSTQFDLALDLEEEGLTGWLEYGADLFDAPTIGRLALHLEALLAAAVAEPDRRLSDLPFLSGAERSQLLMEWNDTAAAARDVVCIHEQIAAQAARTPDAVAAICDREIWTYRRLAAEAGRVALGLRRLGVRPGDCVGVCQDRSLPLLAALLGTLRAGAAYVPLEPSYPEARRSGMLEDSRAGVLIDRRFLDGLPEDADGSDGEALPPDAPAYLLYTSGSTGAPKGVVVSHRNVASFFAAMDGVLGGGPGVWLAVTSVSFDISVLELLWTLSRGFRVILQEEGVRSTISAVRAQPVRPLDFSLFYFADAGGGQEDKYRLLLEGARFADRAGFKAVWTPERHFHSFGGLYPNPSVTGAAVAAVTERVEVRAGSVVLPLHDPLRVAEEWSVVDNLSRGRVGISFASGWHADDFVLAPDGFAGRKDALVSGVETVRRLWRGEAVRRRNGAGSEIEVRIQPRPVQAELPVWITAAGSAETFRLAGEMGAGILTHLLGQTLEEVTEKVAVYREAHRKARDGAPGTAVLMLHTFLGDSLESVRETVRAPFTGYLRSSVGLLRNLAHSLALGDDLDRLPPADLDALLDHAFERYFETGALFGTVESCRGTIDRLRAADVDEVACLVDFGVGFGAAISSLERLAELRDAVGTEAVMAAEARPEDASVPAQIARQGVTHLQCTPSMAGLLAADPAALSALGSLRALLVGGETLAADLAARLLAAVAPGGGELWNLYGPTETTVWSLAHPVEQKGRVPIGRPLSNTEARLLDRDGRLVPVGVPGEVFLGGDGVAAGYWRRPDLTAERFLPDPFAGRPGARLYRTGDLGRFRKDGVLDFLGRIDHQVKVRGHRVEPGEIESALRAHPGVREAVVVARDDAPGGAGLVAYVVPAAAMPEPLRRRGELPAGRRSFELPNGLTVATLSDFQASTGYREIFEDEVYLRHGVSLPDGACVFDVGANIGFFTLWAHGRCRSPRIYAFEPLPPTFETLCANVELYGLDVRLFHRGVADRPGRADFTFYRNAPGLSGRIAGAGEDREEVRAIVLDWLEKAGPAAELPPDQLDAVLDEHLRAETFECELVTLSDVIRDEKIERIDLLKIDVERSELDVLRGIRDEDWSRIDQIVLEVHSRELLRRISALLAGRGYELATEDVAVVEEGNGRRPVQVHMLYAVSPRVRERSGAVLAAGELRRHLAESLPAAMIPAAFVPLEAMPLTISGKIDRRALPAPGGTRPRLEAAYVAPRTRTEEAVAAVWREVLARDRVGIHDNFFEAGGNSLLLVQLQARLREVLGRDLSMVEIFRNPTVHALARLTAPAEPAATGERARRPEPLPEGGALDRQRRFLEERKQRKAQRRPGS